MSKMYICQDKDGTFYFRHYQLISDPGYEIETDLSDVNNIPKEDIIMEPIQGKYQFGIRFNKQEPGTYNLGLLYMDTKRYWEAETKIWGQDFEEEPYPVKKLVISLIFFDIEIGTIWKEDKQNEMSKM